MTGLDAIHYVEHQRGSFLSEATVKTLTSRELRENTSQVWRDLPEQQQIVATLNGRPVGILTPTSGDTLDADLRAIRRARVMLATQSR